MNKINFKVKTDSYFNFIEFNCWLKFVDNISNQSKFKQNIQNLSKNLKQLLYDDYGDGCFVDLDTRDSPSNTAFFEIRLSIPIEKSIKDHTMNKLKKIFYDNNNFSVFLNENKKRKRA